MIAAPAPAAERGRIAAAIPPGSAQPAHVPDAQPTRSRAGGRARLGVAGSHVRHPCTAAQGPHRRSGFVHPPPAADRLTAARRDWVHPCGEFRKVPSVLPSRRADGALRRRSLDPSARLPERAYVFEYRGTLRGQIGAEDRHLRFQFFVGGAVMPEDGCGFGQRVRLSGVQFGADLAEGFVQRHRRPVKRSGCGSA